MKNIGKLAVLGATLAVSASFAFADTITLGSFGSTSVYNPGTITVSNTELTYVGAQTSTSDTTGCGAATYCLPAYTGNTSTSGAFATDLNPNNVWNNALTNSSWEGINGTAGPVNTSNPQYGYYEFTTTFTSNGGLYSGDLNVMADDTTEVLLNGVVIPGLSFGAFGSDAHCADNAPTCLTQDNDILSNISLLNGTNTLEFVVEQAGTGPAGGTGDPSGVDFSGSLTQTPEPSGLILLGTGLIGAAGLLFRRRRVVA